MIEIKKLDKFMETNKGYGGHSGSKKGITINGEDYLLKYPKSAKSMDTNLSYTTTPLSEYLGSQIYKIIGIDVHETFLGISNGKLVVACKDFLKNTEIIIDFNAIKNVYDEEIEEFFSERHSSKFDRNDDLESVIYLMEHNIYFKKIKELKNRFWDMFIVDAFISNNDRNEANWGLIYDRDNKSLRLAPVYDNGAAFYGKSDDDKLKDILNNSIKFRQMTYDSCVSTFVKDGKIINPLKYIESMENEDCNQALLRIYSKIDMEKIKELFDLVPNKVDGIDVFSDVKKELYYKMLEYKYENVFKPVFEKIK